MLETEELLEKHGWTEECGSPFEIRHTDGSFATGSAAWTVLSALRSEELEEHPQFEYQINLITPFSLEEVIGLKNMGNDGWELVSILQYTDSTAKYYFKRKKE